MSVYAVLIDADNLPASVMPQTLQILKSRGTIQVCKVFGDFSCSNLGNWKDMCIRFNLESIMAWRKRGKNSSDLKLCQSCTHMLYRYPELDDYVLVTGDGDFSTVIQDLKQHGKRVICMGVEEHCSTVLKTCCDEFIALPNSTAVARPYKTSAALLTKKRLINTSIDRQFEMNDNNPINCGTLKTTLLRENPSFTETNFNQPSFVQLMKYLGYKIVKNSGRTPFVVKL